MFDNWVKASILFYNFIGGVGLLLAGFGGFKIFLNWLAEHKKRKEYENYVVELKSRYPVNELNKTFELIRNKADPNPIFLWDKIGDRKRHWISSGKLFRDLGFEPIMVKRFNPEEFNKIKKGDSFYP